MNKIFLIGRLTHTPELKETATGVKVCKFSIAVNRSYKNENGERKTDFFNCTAWRGTAETVATYAGKGDRINVVGSLEVREYESRDGIKKTAVDVLVTDVELLGERERTEESVNTVQNVERRRPTLQQMDDDGDSPF